MIRCPSARRIHAFLQSEVLWLLTIVCLAWLALLSTTSLAAATGSDPRYRDGVLIAMDDYYRQQVASDPELKTYDEKYNAAWKRFIALFAEREAAIIRKLQWERFKNRQEFLAASVGDPTAFLRAVVALDWVHLEYMEQVAHLMQARDVRLLLAIRPLVEAIETDPEKWLVMGNLAGLLHKGSITSEYRELEGMGYFRDSFATSGEYALERSGDDLLGYMDTGSSGFSVVRISGGKLSVVTPALPAREAFFRSGKEEWPNPDNITVEATPMPRLGLEPGPPITLWADMVLENRYHQVAAIAQCRIPYHWDGQALSPGNPICREDGAWGIVRIPETECRDIPRPESPFSNLTETEAAQRFESLFDPATVAMLTQRKWVDALQQRNFMELVLELAQTPDARLLMALEALLDFESEKGRGQLGFPCIHPGRVEFLLGQMDRVESVSFSLDGMRASALKRDPGHSSWDLRLEQGPDKALWGVIRYSGGDRYFGYSSDRLIRIADGKISALVAKAPEPEDFFRTRNKKHVFDPWSWQYDGKDCNMMLPVISVQGRPPYAVRAEYANADKGYPLGFPDECIAECSIVYQWDGKTYAPARWDCLPEGQWGIFPREPEDDDEDQP